MPTCFKVVAKKKNEYTSCVAKDFYELTYRLGEWTRPIDESKIFVFIDLESAQEWVGVGDTILECEYEGVPEKIFSRLGVISEKPVFNAFWKNWRQLIPHNKLIGSIYLYQTPPDSHVVDAVKPIRVAM